MFRAIRLCAFAGVVVASTACGCQPRMAEAEPEASGCQPTAAALVEAHGPNCEEFLHAPPGRSPVIVLTRTALGIQIVEHAITGEQRALKPGTEWVLKYHQGWAFLQTPGRPPAWASTLLKSSVWKTPSGTLFVKTKEASGCQPSITLVRELPDGQTSRDVEWPAAEGVVALPEGSVVLEMRVPRSGAKFFWMLACFQDAAHFKAQTSQTSTWIKGMMKKSWTKVLSRHCVPQDAVARPFVRGAMRPSADTGGDGAASGHTQTWGVSTHALLTLLLTWATHMESDHDRKQSHGLLNGLFKTYFTKPCVLKLSWGEYHGFGAPPADPRESVEIEYDGAVVSRVGGALGHMAVTLHGVSAVEMLLRARSWAQRSSFFLNLLYAMATVIDEVLSTTDWLAAEQSAAAAPARPGRRAFRAHRGKTLLLRRQGKVRSCFCESGDSRAKGLRAWHHKTWVDAAWQKRYLLATRRLTAESWKSCALTPDKSRVSGRDILMTSAWFPDVRRAAWAPPQATTQQ